MLSSYFNHCTLPRMKTAKILTFAENLLLIMKSLTITTRIPML